MTPLTLSAAALAVMVVVMLLLWLTQRRTGNAGVVDVGWSAGVGVAGVAFALLAPGDPGRRVVAAAMVGLWSARLAGHILLRVLFEPEDGRYRRLRSDWGRRFQPRLFAFFQAQAVLAVLFAVPVLVVVWDPRPLDPLRTAVAVSLWLAAVGGEAVADRQLARFRAEPSNRGRTCRVGLWRLSRHPNYFFEWLGWWPWVVLGIDAPWGALTLLGPVLMLLFLLFVTGVPATEARAAASRPDYADYRRTTSAFIPWLPRKRER